MSGTSTAYSLHAGLSSGSQINQGTQVCSKEAGKWKIFENWEDYLSAQDSSWLRIDQYKTEPKKKETTISKFIKKIVQKGITMAVILERVVSLTTVDGSTKLAILNSTYMPPEVDETIRALGSGTSISFVIILNNFDIKKTENEDLFVNALKEQAFCNTSKRLSDTPQKINEQGASNESDDLDVHALASSSTQESELIEASVESDAHPKRQKIDDMEEHQKKKSIIKKLRDGSQRIDEYLLSIQEKKAYLSNLNNELRVFSSDDYRLQIEYVQIETLCQLKSSHLALRQNSSNDDIKSMEEMVERSKSLKFLDLYGFLRQGETFLSSNYDVPTMKPIEVQIAESADLSSDGNHGSSSSSHVLQISSDGNHGPSSSSHVQIKAGDLKPMNDQDANQGSSSSSSCHSSPEEKRKKFLNELINASIRVSPSHRIATVDTLLAQDAVVSHTVMSTDDTEERLSLKELKKKLKDCRYQIVDLDCDKNALERYVSSHEFKLRQYASEEFRVKIQFVQMRKVCEIKLSKLKRGKKCLLEDLKKIEDKVNTSTSRVTFGDIYTFMNAGYSFLSSNYE